jgi:fructose-1,6-bisphosphatase
MKKIIFVILLLLSLIRSFGQQQTSPAPSITKTDYLQKSKSQKTAGWILFGGGTAMMITGTVIWINAIEEDIFTEKGNGLAVA